MKTGLKVICCGSRDFWDSALIHDVLSTWKPSAVAHGGANGADLLARDAAHDLSVIKPGHHAPVIEPCCFVTQFRAEWERYGAKAGPIRNQTMLDNFKPDAVFAFVHDVDRPTPGTADMIRQARKAGVPVMVFGGRK